MPMIGKGPGLDVRTPLGKRQGTGRAAAGKARLTARTGWKGYKWRRTHPLTAPMGGSFTWIVVTVGVWLVCNAAWWDKTLPTAGSDRSVRLVQQSRVWVQDRTAAVEQCPQWFMAMAWRQHMNTTASDQAVVHQTRQWMQGVRSCVVQTPVRLRKDHPWLDWILGIQKSIAYVWVWPFGRFITVRPRFFQFSSIVRARVLVHECLHLRFALRDLAYEHEAASFRSLRGTPNAVHNADSVSLYLVHVMRTCSTLATRSVSNAARTPDFGPRDLSVRAESGGLGAIAPNPMSETVRKIG